MITSSPAPTTTQRVEPGVRRAAESWPLLRFEKLPHDLGGKAVGVLDPSAVHVEGDAVGGVAEAGADGGKRATLVERPGGAGRGGGWSSASGRRRRPAGSGGRASPAATARTRAPGWRRRRRRGATGSRPPSPCRRRWRGGAGGAPSSPRRRTRAWGHRSSAAA